jgi:hypothetical protein
MTAEEFQSRLRATGIRNINDPSALSIVLTMFKTKEIEVREKCARKCELLLTGANRKGREYLRGHDDALTTAALEIRKGNLE